MFISKCRKFPTKKNPIQDVFYPCLFLFPLNSFAFFFLFHFQFSSIFPVIIFFLFFLSPWKGEDVVTLAMVMDEI
jgi:hypothetical protein